MFCLVITLVFMPCNTYIFGISNSNRNWLLRYRQVLAYKRRGCTCLEKSMQHLLKEVALVTLFLHGPEILEFLSLEKFATGMSKMDQNILDFFLHIGVQTERLAMGYLCTEPFKIHFNDQNKHFLHHS